jgi:4-diphosphocytidyl-2-C-methyl-D-erythritol kinase
MGGFEGGDEGGFWDVDVIRTLVDKQNTNKAKNPNREKPYIKITDSAYTIQADLYETISLVPCKCKTFTLEGCDDMLLESNPIYKTYKALCDYTVDSEIEEFFYEHKVVVTKSISPREDSKNASSDAVAFMSLVKEACNLMLSNEELAKIEIGL